MITPPFSIWARPFFVTQVDFFAVLFFAAMARFSHTIRTTMADEIRLNDEERGFAAGRVLIPRARPGARGQIASVNVSFPGGVPKRPIARTTIGTLGLAGDGQRSKPPVHGGPSKAVCLYGVEQIGRVNADGHDLYPGALGENLTLSGLDLGGLAAGDTLRIGDTAGGPIIELTEPAAPCKNIATCFSDWRIARVSAKVRPEDTRWYARVLREGPVQSGDPVELLDPAATIAAR
jgi:MOSC domain-containing protein YiiM